MQSTIRVCARTFSLHVCISSQQYGEISFNGRVYETTKTSQSRVFVSRAKAYDALIGRDLNAYSMAPPRRWGTTTRGFQTDAITAVPFVRKR